MSSSQAQVPSSNIPIRRPLDLRATVLMLLLCVVWGIQQPAMKAIAGDIAPTMQLAVRFAGAAIFFGLLVMIREGRRAFSDGTLRSGLLLGLMFSGEFILVGEAITHTTAAHTVVFLYTSPIFTALGLQFLPEERLSTAQWAGIAVAFSGIVVAFLGYGGRPVAELIKGDSLAVCAGAIWGMTNVVLRRGRIGSAATAKTVFYQVGLATVLIGGYAAASGQTVMVFSHAAIVSLLFQTVIIAISSYLLWFWLLRHYLTSRLMLMTLLTPLFGVVFGVTLLHDPIEWRFAIGAALVLSGVMIVNARLGRRNV